MKRLPDQARALNRIFVLDKKKQVVRLEVLFTKYNLSNTLESDIQSVIDSSNGWLSNIRDWVRKKQVISIMFASELCRQLYLYSSY